MIGNLCYHIYRKTNKWKKKKKRKTNKWMNKNTSLPLHRVCPNLRILEMLRGFPDSSVGKESTCNAGDPGSIPGSGRLAGEGIGYLLQYSWASLVAQLAKNLPAMQENWLQSLGWEDPLEKGYPLQYSGLENSMDWIVHEVEKSQTSLRDFHFQKH